MLKASASLRQRAAIPKKESEDAHRRLAVFSRGFSLDVASTASIGALSTSGAVGKLNTAQNRHHMLFELDVAVSIQKSAP